MIHAVLGIVVVAAAATLGDFIWYSAGVRHTMTAGIVHGALLLAAVGGALGAASGRLIKGLPVGAVAGIGGALSYSLLVVVLDSPTYGVAIPAAWVLMWLQLAALDGRWLRAPDRWSWREVAVRGVLAAATSGLAFALVRNILWGQPPGGERNYVLQFAVWAFAWAPGLLSLMWQPQRQGSRSSRASGVEMSEAQAASIRNVDLLARIDRGDTLNILDVRSEGEFASGHVPGAVNVPFDRVLSGAAHVQGAPSEELFVYCGHGPRADMAAAALRRQGWTRIVYVSGHFSGWRRAGLRIESPATSSSR
jgi:hydroxyacylglutathione hydrolase